MQPYIVWYICRHGETTDNILGIWTGQLHGELSKNGREFAQNDLGKLVSLIQPDAVTSSDLKRAIDTKDLAIGDYHFFNDEDKRLRETRFTGFHGKTMEEIYELISSKGLPELDNLGYYDLRYMLADKRKPLEKEFGAEPIPEIGERVSTFSEDIKKKGNKIITVGHSIINAYVIENELYNTTGNNFKFNQQEYFPQSNTQVTILKYDKAGNLIRDQVELNVPIVEIISKLS